MKAYTLSALTAAVLAVGLTGCGSSSPGAIGRSSGGNVSSDAPNASDGSPAKSLDGCTLVTPAELTQAVGVEYTAISDTNNGSICNVTGATPTDTFYFHVDKEDGPLTTWDAEVATIKQDDGSVKDVAEIGDRAVQGAVKEFAAEAKGYIVVVVNADVNNPSTAASFARSQTIAKLLIVKLG